MVKKKRTKKNADDEFVIWAGFGGGVSVILFMLTLYVDLGWNIMYFLYFMAFVVAVIMARMIYLKLRFKLK